MPLVELGNPHMYTLDLAAELTQVLADGMYIYLYGNGRLRSSTAWTSSTSWAMRWARCGNWPTRLAG